jgi:hypothetical protein
MDFVIPVCGLFQETPDVRDGYRVFLSSSISMLI